MMHSVVKTMLTSFTQDLAEKIDQTGELGLNCFSADGENPDDALKEPLTIC